MKVALPRPIQAWTIGFAVAAGWLISVPRLEGQTPPYRIFGSADLDLAACSAGGPTGAVSTAFWVIRAPTIAGPTHVTVTGLPPHVQVSVSPDTLTYPGWVIGQQVTATFTVDAGVQLPDTVVELTADDGSNTVTNELLLHGTCPRHNKDFTVRGSFFSTQLSKTFPVEGALVEIYRDVPWQLDQRVGSTLTGADGSFEVRLWADDEDTYYAKLRLNDVAGVYLHEAGTPSIKDYNSFNRGSNSQPVIDLGGTVITKDQGAGTPKTAVWQGGRAALQEYIQAHNEPPPTGDYEIVIQYTVTGMTWTARSTTNYEEGTQTFKFDTSSGVRPVAPSDPTFDPYFSQFDNYSVNFHEFGHALRHTVDGDQRHFTDDSSRWTYGRHHSLCGSAHGYVDIEAFGFNEGWAEYWEKDSRALYIFNCGPDRLTDMTIEGAVASDLEGLDQTLALCRVYPPDPAEAARARRRDMFSVLRRGTNIIHSEGEFRSNFEQQFPGCALPPIGVEVRRMPISTMSVSRPQAGLAAKYLAPRVAYYRELVARFRSELAAASREASQLRDCVSMPCKTFAARLIRPAVLRGQIDYASLVGKDYERRLADIRRGGAQVPDMSEAVLERGKQALLEFRKQVQAITLKTLSDGAALLDRRAAVDRTGKLAAISADLKRTARRLQLRGPVNDEVFTLLKLPPSPSDDAIGPFRPAH